MPNANTKSVLLTPAANVSSASAHIEAPIKIASVPLASKGAWKSIHPNLSASTTVSSPVVSFNKPAPAAVAPRTSNAFSD